MATKTDFSKYYLYEDLAEVLHKLNNDYPQNSRLLSIGKSYEGRDIWLMEITNFGKGKPSEKPGYYLQANIHATEVLGSTIALYTINYLLSQYGNDAEVTQLVDDTVFYILPRFSVDGAETVLREPHYTTTSAVRDIPLADEWDGMLQHCDINKDGYMLQMRKVDPEGEWRVSKHDSRVMVPRLPDETGGKYYRLWGEGMVKNFNGVEVHPQIMIDERTGLDYNRNFPGDWRPEEIQPGAGPYPFSEPETRAVGDFVLAHPNIVGIQDYHCTGGMIIRPSERNMNRMDALAMTAIGEIGAKLTGYANVTGDDYSFEEGRPLYGTVDNWFYGDLGIINYCTELWDLRIRAGCSRIPWKDKHQDIESDILKILHWLDENADGFGFVSWEPFNHPQLGPIEIGGWKRLWVWNNPPSHLIEAESHKNCLFVLKHAKCAPKLQIRNAKAQDMGNGLWRCELTIVNTGYLPTSGSERAKSLVSVKPIRVDLSLPDHAQLISGKLKEEIGHLNGRVFVPYFYYPDFDSKPREKKMEWIIQAPKGIKVEATVTSQRAGTERVVIELPD